MQILKLHKLP